jgi:vacuolar-type H+-ATPase subunit I/STV1
MALLLTVMSAFFLIKSVIELAPKDMAELSRTNWDYSLSTARNFAKQKADTVVGFALLMLGLVLSLVNLLWPMRWCDFKVNYVGIIVAIFVSIIIFLASYKASSVLQKHYYKQVENILAPKE